MARKPAPTKDDILLTTMDLIENAERVVALLTQSIEPKRHGDGLGDLGRAHNVSQKLHADIKKLSADKVRMLMSQQLAVRYA